MVASAIAAPAQRDRALGRGPARSRGQISARNAAGPTTSRPNDCGEPTRPAPNAPASVLRFQVRYRLPNVAMKPVRAAAGSGCASVTAVVSSMTPSAASSLRRPARPQQVGQPQAVQRVPAAEQDGAGGAGEQAAAAGDHSGQGELGRAGEGKQAERAGLPAVSPELTAAAPKAMPETPTASPSAMPSRTGRA